MNLFERLLSIILPPRLPGKVEPQTEPVLRDPVLEPLNPMEHGIGTPKPKRYRNGTARYFAEIATMVIVLATVGGAAHADDLPDTPRPTPIALVNVAPVGYITQKRVAPISPIRPAYTRFDKIELGVAITAAAFDTAQTCHNLANGGREDMLPTQHCAPVSLMLFGQVAAQEVVVQILRKTGHQRLARAARLFSIANNVNGIVYSKQHGAW